MKQDWESYWAEALAEYNEADRIFGPGVADDIWSRWPGREEGMSAAYLRGARRHFETVQREDYPEQVRKLCILIYIGIARAEAQLADLDSTAPLSLRHSVVQSTAVKAYLDKVCQVSEQPENAEQDVSAATLAL